ncbi:exo-alpha-sialidase, partial [candidate division KSB1 bacterium]|nr:exo-alpha-sialidase [candidate division KSB1 bacterium]
MTMKIRSILLFLLFVGFSVNTAAQEVTAEIVETRVICHQPGRYIGWPTLTLTTENELIAVFSGDRDAHVCPWGKTQLIRSSDTGITWTDPVTINNTPLDDRDAGILQTDQGTWVVSWFTSVFFIYALELYPQSWPQEITRCWPRHIEKLDPEVRERYIG